MWLLLIFLAVFLFFAIPRESEDEIEDEEEFIGELLFPLDDEDEEF